MFGAAGVAVATLCGCRAAVHEPGPRHAIGSMIVLGDELLAALGPEVRARTVAVSALADDRRYSLSAAAWPAEMPRLSKNPEDAIALELEVLVVASFTDEEYRAAVRPAIPHVVELGDFTGLEGYLANVTRVGEAVGAVTQAAALREAFSARIAAVRAQQAHTARPPTCLTWGHGSVAGANTTFHAAAEAAGCVNMPALAGLDGHRRVDAEQVVAWDPDFIILSCRDDGENDCDAARADFAAQAGFGELRALKQGQTIMIPPPFLSTTGAGMAELAERIQAGLAVATADIRGVTERALPGVATEELACDR